MELFMSRKPRELGHWKIHTKTKGSPEGRCDFEYVVLTDNPEYAELVQLEKDKKLPRTDPKLTPRAWHLHTTEMLEDTPPRVQANVDGTIEIDYDQPELARRVMDILQNLDHTIYLDIACKPIPSK
jgi:hypothetical protein